MLAGVVLCGGASTRMGRDKALIELEGESLIVRAARLLSEVADPVFVASGGRTYPVEHEHIEDAGPDSGPLGGIVAALRKSPHDLLAVVAVDMPFISPSLFTHLARGSEGANAVVPADDHGPQPLHAVYTRSALPLLEDALAEGELSMRAALDRIGARIERHDGPFARNINEPGDLESVVEKSSGG